MNGHNLTKNRIRFFVKSKSVRSSIEGYFLSKCSSISAIWCCNACAEICISLINNARDMINRIKAKPNTHMAIA